ncbi:MAG TPA: 50S ribosomal protein L33 [Alphaproteobacteria bacterium]
MAKKGATVKVKMVSTAGTGYYYVTKVNKKTKTEKLVKKKFDPRAKHPTTGKPGAHVDFKEDKVK